MVVFVKKQTIFRTHGVDEIVVILTYLLYTEQMREIVLQRFLTIPVVFKKIAILKIDSFIFQNV